MQWAVSHIKYFRFIDMDQTRVKIILERLVSGWFFYEKNLPAHLSNLFHTEKSADNFDSKEKSCIKKVILKLFLLWFELNIVLALKLSIF